MKLREKFNVSDKKIADLFDRMSKLDLYARDIEEKISIGGGRGGQKLNKTANRIQLTHRPSGISVSCQRERQRNRNRFIALRMLVEKIEERRDPATSKRALKAKKIIKQKRKRRKRARQKLSKNE